MPEKQKDEKKLLEKGKIMKRKIFLFILFLSLGGGCQSEENFITNRGLNPAFIDFPESSLVDFSFLLDPPAGKYGFLKVTDDGHFCFERNNQKVRFWGITVAADNVDIPKEQISNIVSVIARSGCNLVRFHEIDNRGAEKYGIVRRCVISDAYPNQNNSRNLDPDYLDRLDWWVKCCKEKGLYVYLVIRGYRTFKIDDGVANADQLQRAAKPYAMFSQKLIDLQKEYAQKFLFEHINPYTGLPFGRDPAICLLEVENEDSLFFDPGNWKDYISSYKEEFYDYWIKFLKGKYGDTEKLKNAWTDESGYCCLLPDENLENGKVNLPSGKFLTVEHHITPQKFPPLEAPLRVRESLLFASELQRKYFREMKEFIRSKGCQIPLTATVNSEIALDTWTVAQELDCIGENNYLDHPSFSAGAEWIGKPCFSLRNQIKDVSGWAAMSYILNYKWAKKPVVVREWATCWPNPYRGAGVLERAAYAAFQDLDVFIFFSHYTHYSRDQLSSFGIQADPLQWGIWGYAGYLFIKGDIETGQKSVGIGFSDEDFLTWLPENRKLYTILPYVYRLENYYQQGKFQNNPYYYLISSGSAWKNVSYPTQNTILFSRLSDKFLNNQNLYPLSIFAKSGYSMEGVNHPETANLTKLGGDNILYDEKKNNYLCLESDPGKIENFISGKIAQIKDKTFTNETQEIIRDSDRGIITILGKSICAIAGEFESGKDYKFGKYTFKSQSKIATVTIFENERFKAIKRTSAAKNRGEKLVKVEENKYVLDSSGSPPVQTLGQRSSVPEEISYQDKTLLKAFLQNGTYELVEDKVNKLYYLFCDTPNIQFILGEGGQGEYEIEINYYEVQPTKIKTKDLIYPGYAKFIKIYRLK